MPSQFEPGVKCWYPDSQLGWVGVTVTSVTPKDEKYEVRLQRDDAEDDADPIVVVATALDESDSALPPLRNPPLLEAPEDLTNLSYLNEPAVLNAIRMRYSRLNIYTYSGIVLIAVNPFQRVDHLYSHDIIQTYSRTTRAEQEPHLFAIANEAYTAMTRDEKNQTVIVSGESGAGKTVSAKYIMRYLASVDPQNESFAGGFSAPAALQSRGHPMSKVEQQILATNPIMESFGNAKTTRNDNSSRFGKYLEILFDSQRAIIGARIRTYLLERSRIVFQPATERNYHIFYQLCAGLPESDRTELHLKPATEFFYLNQGGDITVAGIDDAEEFAATRSALELIGVGSEKQMAIFRILSGILHIGNIVLAPTRNDAVLSAEEPSLVTACELLGLDPAMFSKWIVKKQITTRSEKIVSSLNHRQAVVARDSVAKFIYACLFDWLVRYINDDLCPPDVAEAAKSFIGVLDIYGFEHFEKNSFEQFCINYANEKLQQEFNRHVFKLEQEEYVREEIEWQFISFSDNQPCIDLIEGKIGILSLLDEESRLPAGSDDSWITKLYASLAKPPTDKVFRKPRFGQTKFVVAHYALDVTYDSEGFIEKNRDTVSEGQLETLRSSTNELLLEMLDVGLGAGEPQPEQARPGARGGKKKPTLGSIFKSSLGSLMQTINSTNAHYIRCIKPNEQKAAWEFDPLMVLAQLRACGVLETIRISCAGFPTRWTYEEFAERYYMLIHSSLWAPDYKSRCNNILQATVEDSSRYQLGNSKIFFKAGMLAYLEGLRARRVHECAVLIQKNLRRLYYRRKYLAARAAVVALQTAARGYAARARIQRERETRAAVLLQAGARGFLVRRRMAHSVAAVVAVQAVARGRLVRLALRERLLRLAAVAIQTAWRSKAARQQLSRTLWAAVYVQCCLRRKMAVRELRKLKVEARSVNHFKEISGRLENKVVELTQTLTAKTAANKALQAEIEELRAAVAAGATARETLATREAEFTEERDNLKAAHVAELAELQSAIEARDAEKAELEAKLAELEAGRAEQEAQLATVAEELAEARKQLEEEKTAQGSLQQMVADLKTEIASLNSELTAAKAAAALGVAAGVGGAGGAAASAAAFAGSPRGRGMRRSLSPGGAAVLNGSPRPVSVSGVESVANRAIEANRGLDSKLIDDELLALLCNEQLHAEVVDGLIKGLKIPPSSIASKFQDKEVLFPARAMIIILSDMWRLGLIHESELFLTAVFQEIQNLIINYKDEDVVDPGAFWLSNVFEMYSFVTHAHSLIVSNKQLIEIMGDTEYKEYLSLAVIVKEDFESLGYNVYHTWLKKLRKTLDKIAIPAVVTSQSLPGFVTGDSTLSSAPLIGKFMGNQPEIKMDSLLSFLNAVYWAMQSYKVEKEIMNSTIAELIRYIDVTCFNDLLIRRNFLSWKRGLQLNYNVTRLEEWCKSHEVPEGTSCLTHLFQAAKLLQLKKTTPDDIEIIYEICYSLKPNQIQKLIAQYHNADYEPPISSEISQILAQKVLDHKDERLFEDVHDNNQGGPFDNVNVRQFYRIEAYVPAWLQVPMVKRVAELVSANASVPDEAQEAAEM